MWCPYSCGDGKEQQQVRELHGGHYLEVSHIADYLTSGLDTVLATVVVMVHLTGAIAAAPRLAGAGAGMLRYGCALFRNLATVCMWYLWEKC